MNSGYFSPLDRMLELPNVPAVIYLRLGDKTEYHDMNWSPIFQPRLHGSWLLALQLFTLTQSQSSLNIIFVCYSTPLSSFSPLLSSLPLSSFFLSSHLLSPFLLSPFTSPHIPFTLIPSHLYAPSLCTTLFCICPCFHFLFTTKTKGQSSKDTFSLFFFFKSP